MAPFSSIPFNALPHAPPPPLPPPLFQPPSTTITAAPAVFNSIPQFPHTENPNSNSSNNLATDSSLVVTQNYAGKKRKCRTNSENTQLSKKEKEKKVQKKKREEGGESPKGYIHVRARRGQATDSHSLAERVRRERISERMKLLQGLVPGCDKVTGKALMLDAIINYVQSLQNQVEFLSMKLASVNPMFYEFDMELDSFMVTPLHQDISINTSTNLAALGCTNILTPPNSNTNIDNLLETNIFPQPHPLQGSRQSLWEMEDDHSNTLLSSFH